MNNTNKIHLIIYGDHRYYKTKIRLENEAKISNWFDSITLYDYNDLDNDFKNKYNNILKENRSGGFCIWKPYFLKKKINEIDNNDILVYLDAGCKINNKAFKRFNEYIEILNNKSIICFQLNNEANSPDAFFEKTWTTKEIFDYFDCVNDNNICNTNQFVGGILLFKKNQISLNIINTFYNVIKDNVLLFTNYYNNNQNSYFIDNRHDQSIFSIIRKKNIKYCEIIKDETYPPNNINFPFWASRILDKYL